MPIENLKVESSEVECPKGKRRKSKKLSVSTEIIEATVHSEEPLKESTDKPVESVSQKQDFKDKMDIAEKQSAATDCVETELSEGIPESSERYIFKPRKARYGKQTLVSELVPVEDILKDAEEKNEAESHTANDNNLMEKIMETDVVVPETRETALNENIEHHKSDITETTKSKRGRQRKQTFEPQVTESEVVKESTLDNSSVDMSEKQISKGRSSRQTELHEDITKETTETSVPHLKLDSLETETPKEKRVHRHKTQQVEIESTGIAADTTEEIVENALDEKAPQTSKSGKKQDTEHDDLKKDICESSQEVVLETTADETVKQTQEQELEASEKTTMKPVDDANVSERETSPSKRGRHRKQNLKATFEPVFDDMKEISSENEPLPTEELSIEGTSKGKRGRRKKHHGPSETAVFTSENAPEESLADKIHLTTESAELSSPKGKKGRPRKPLSESEATGADKITLIHPVDHVTADSSEEIIFTEKRGRKRSHPEQDLINALTDQETQQIDIVPKGKRGRHRKQLLEKEPSVEQNIEQVEEITTDTVKEEEKPLKEDENDASKDNELLISEEQENKAVIEAIQGTSKESIQENEQEPSVETRNKAESVEFTTAVDSSSDLNINTSPKGKRSRSRKQQLIPDVKEEFIQLEQVQDDSISKRERTIIEPPLDRISNQMFTEFEQHSTTEISPKGKKGRHRKQLLEPKKAIDFDIEESVSEIQPSTTELLKEASSKLEQSMEQHEELANDSFSEKDEPDKDISKNKTVPEEPKPDDLQEMSSAVYLANSIQEIFQTEETVLEEMLEVEYPEINNFSKDFIVYSDNKKVSEPEQITDNTAEETFTATTTNSDLSAEKEAIPADVHQESELSKTDLGETTLEVQEQNDKSTEEVLCENNEELSKTEVEHTECLNLSNKKVFEHDVPVTEASAAELAENAEEILTKGNVEQNQLKETLTLDRTPNTTVLVQHSTEISESSKASKSEKKRRLSETEHVEPNKQIIHNPNETDVSAKTPERNVEKVDLKPKGRRGRSRKSTSLSEYKLDDVPIDLQTFSEVPPKDEVIIEHGTNELLQEIDGNESTESFKPKKGRGRPRKQSIQHEKHEELVKVPEETSTWDSDSLLNNAQSISMHPKKNKWSRRESPHKTEIDNILENKLQDVLVDIYQNNAESIPQVNKKDNEIEVKVSEESELILPLKKSKRVNDISNLTSSQASDIDIFTSTSNTAERKIENNEFSETVKSSEFAEPSDIFKCVHPKKKKIEEVNNEPPKVEEIPKPPKKKIQKLFEITQTFERLNDMPLMSPLAKKKSFLFQQEDYENFQILPDIKEPEHDEAKARDSSSSKGVDVDEFFNLPKKRKIGKVCFEDVPESRVSSIENNLEDVITQNAVEPASDNSSESSLSVQSSERIGENSNLEQPNVSECTSDLIQSTIPADIPFLPESELVPIEGTLTVMSEKDLADAQVEITPDKVISEKKPMTLGTFSMDFSDVGLGSIVQPRKKESVKSRESETVSKVSAKVVPATTTSHNTSSKSDLLDMLESSSNSSSSESKCKLSFESFEKKTMPPDMFDFEDAIPSQIVLSNKIQGDSSVLLDSPRLLERLSRTKDASKKVIIQSNVKLAETKSKTPANKSTKTTVVSRPPQKIVIKTKTGTSAVKPPISSKPIILSEQIIRPAHSSTAKPQSQGVKRQFEDVEDIETAFIIPKIAKKSVEEEVVVALTPERGQKVKQIVATKSNAKAKILQQTIITSKGEIIQPQTTTTTTTTTTQPTQLQTDDIVFDINSMPIVLSDDLLTPESIQNMPVVLSEEVAQKNKEKSTAALVKKVVAGIKPKQQIIFKTTKQAPGNTVSKQTVKPRILGTATTATTKVSRPGPGPGPAALLAGTASIDGKATKYVLVSSSVATSTSLPQGKAVKPVIRKTTPTQSKLPSVASTESPSTQPVGNKIMIVTNQHGQQHRVVLTPQQQKVLMQAQSGAKVTKTIIKGGIPKGILDASGAGPSGVVAKPAVASSSIVSSSPSVSGQSSSIVSASKVVKTPVHGKKVVQKTTGKPQKTILIKNQLGQTVRRIQGTDDAELDRQVAEQLEAIKASARQQQANKCPEIINFTSRQFGATKTSRKSYVKKTEVVVKSKALSKSTDTVTVPALAPISAQTKASCSTQATVSRTPVIKEKPTESLLQVALPNQTDTKPSKGGEAKPDRPLNQLVIQDALGNQTTITEGQILALPSETVDGQPQSYMLVTLDETGNLTPLNNEALMSLDPSLGLGGDINNVVLQVDQGQGIVASVKPADVTPNITQQKKIEDKVKVEPKKVIHETSPKPLAIEQSKTQEMPLPVNIGETSSLPPDPPLGGQQLIVTGDPIATQKFLESLSDGTTDLANILANAEGGSVIIQADGQQILIKTTATGDAQSMLGLPENPEGAGNPVFSSHKPNQDILAAALADTDVFQGSEQTSGVLSGKGQLSPSGSSGAMYPMHVSDVLKTSLTLSSPIMTPLEVPSTKGKKIDDEAEILNQVPPRNVDLPITITDPNISQTVAQQQSATSLMELALPITDAPGAPDMNSPSSYAYVLPTLDEAVGIIHKPFNSSMPLLTEDVTEVESNSSVEKEQMLGDKDLGGDHPNEFDSLSLLQENMDSSKDHPKADAFGDISSLPLLTDDVVEDSTSSIDSTKLSRSSPKPKERDIVNEGLCTLGGEMCSSLSEPPPDMFDLGPMTAKEEEISSDLSSMPEGSTLSPCSVGSGEIPLQPHIVATLSDLKRAGSEDLDSEQDEKRQRYD